MAFCSKCGAEIVDGAKFCPICGQPSNVVSQQQLNQFQQQYGEQQEEEMKLWQKILYVLVGPAGLLAGFVYMIRKKKAMAKSALIWGAVGTLLWIGMANMGEGSNSDLENATKELLIQKFKEDGTNLVVKDITLVHKSGNEYEGVAECKVDGEDAQYSLKVLSDGTNVQVEWELSAIGSANSEDAEEDESEVSNSVSNEVAEEGYNDGYRMGFQMADVDVDPDAKISFTTTYGPPSTPEEKQMYNIYKQNYERGYREGKRAGRE